MRILFWSLVILAAFAGALAVRLQHKIRSKALRVFLSLFGALGILALAIDELRKLTDGFESWRNLLGIGVLVPVGWFLAGCFVLYYAFERGE